MPDMLARPDDDGIPPAHAGPRRATRQVAAIGMMAGASALLLASVLAAGLHPALAAAPIARSSCGGVGPPANDGPLSQTAHVTLSRTGGAMGTLIAASGSGWPRGDSIGVHVEYVDSSGDGYSNANGTLAVGTVGSDGTFSGVQFRLPLDYCNGVPAPDTTARVVVQDFRAGTPITALAALSMVASPQLALKVPGTVVTSGDTLNVAGSGWSAGTAVTVTLGQYLPTSGFRPTLVQPLQGAVSVQVSADGGGTFVASVPVARTIRPGTPIQAMASTTTAQYGDLAFLSPSTVKVAPAQQATLQLEHPSGDAHTKVTLIGSNWWPGDTLSVGACSNLPCSPGSRELSTLTTVQVDQSGSFRVDFDPPTQWGVGRVIQFAVYPIPYDSVTSEYYFGNARYALLTTALRPRPVTSVAPPKLTFDLGAVIGLVMLIVVLAIVAEPVARRRRTRMAHARAQRDAHLDSAETP